MGNDQKGFTILEVMLVLVIAATIVYMSISQYQNYRRDADVIQLEANVNTIFQAMGQYYKVNCDGWWQSNKMQYGALHPEKKPPSPFQVDIQELKDNGFLADLPAFNPLVDEDSEIGTKGYVAQFNQGQPVKRKICTESQKGAPDGPDSADCTRRADTGTIYVWRAQVAVELKNPDLAEQYLNILRGDCLSSAQDNVVAPCSDKTGGTYVVWERLPGHANTGVKSSSWLTIPTVSQFKQMYTTYPILNLTNKFKEPDQYYLCGG
jgi:prepilin-type N-terminal cleavage/methylation domain-containing protein